MVHHVAFPFSVAWKILAFPRIGQSVSATNAAELHSAAAICCTWGDLVDPILPTVSSVTNFLADQFAKGRQYRTINIARSALSATLPSVDGQPVGQHQDADDASGVESTTFAHANLAIPWNLERRRSRPFHSDLGPHNFYWWTWPRSWFCSWHLQKRPGLASYDCWILARSSGYWMGHVSKAMIRPRHNETVHPEFSLCQHCLITSPFARWTVWSSVSKRLAWCALQINKRSASCSPPFGPIHQRPQTLWVIGWRWPWRRPASTPTTSRHTPRVVQPPQPPLQPEWRWPTF